MSSRAQAQHGILLREYVLQCAFIDPDTRYSKFGASFALLLSLGTSYHESAHMVNSWIATYLYLSEVSF